MLDLVFVDATEGFSRSLRVVVKPGAENVMVNCEGCTDVAFALQPEHWGYRLRSARCAPSGCPSDPQALV